MLTIGMLMLFACAPSIAHAEDDYLIGSDPQPHQELNEAPGWVTLAFASRANARLAKVLVLDASGKNVTTGPLIVEGTNVTTQLVFDLPRGTYSVYYRTSGSDGKPRGGAFQFAYGKGEWTPLDKEVWVGEAEQPPIIANPDPNATAPATTTASPGVQPSETSSPSVQPSDSPSAIAGSTVSPEAQPADAGSSATGWWIAAGVVVAALVAGAVVLMRRRNARGSGEAGEDDSDSPLG